LRAVFARDAALHRRLAARLHHSCSARSRTDTTGVGDVYAEGLLIAGPFLALRATRLQRLAVCVRRPDRAPRSALYVLVALVVGLHHLHLIHHHLPFVAILMRWLTD